MDVNDQQCDGAMDSVMEVRDIAAKFRAFGAVCVEIDAHDLDAMRQAKAEPHEGQPLIILARSSPTKGMSFLQKRFPRLHYVRFKSEDERAEMNKSIAAELGIDPDRTGDALMVEMVNRPYASAFEAYAVKHPDVLCLSADLTSSCEIDGFRDRHPDQFLSLGMAEQNMMSFAGGLGLAGFRPFLHSFGVFLYRRPYDQLMASVAYPRRKVRLMGFLPGITTPGGMTHQAIEDVA
jgi:deoxyxylulose-5-phosphate synthase